MNNASETLKKVKAVLGLEVKMEQLKLENGTILEADKFAEGEAVFIVTEDEKVALPVGTYELEDNKTLVVEQEGVISKLAEEDEEIEEEVEEVEEKEAEEEAELEYVSREEFSMALEEIKKMIEEVKAGYGKKEMSDEAPVENQNNEISEQEELAAELAKPAVQPFKHSPEKVADRKMVRFAKNRPMNTLDTVFQKLNSKN
tara:strand:- start:5048 stop:5650 length:603 start_codon:yes stop_codon:yes gene_type:complete